MAHSAHHRVRNSSPTWDGSHARAVEVHGLLQALPFGLNAFSRGWHLLLARLIAAKRYQRLTAEARLDWSERGSWSVSRSSVPVTLVMWPLPVVSSTRSM